MTEAKHWVTIEDTGQGFEVSPDDTLLSGLLRLGVGVPYECNSGGCGSCKYTLVDGKVTEDYDAPAGLRQSDKRKNKHLACVSRVGSDCTIQLKTDQAYVPQLVPQKCRATLRSINKLTHDLWEFQFKSDSPARFLPGQYAKVIISEEVGSRCYSMSNLANGAGNWHFIIKNDLDGAASSILFNKEIDNMPITIDAPYSIAHLNPQSPRKVVCIAGGSGLAPMVSILRGIAQEQGDIRSSILYYGARTPKDVVNPDYFSGIPNFDSKKQYIPIISETNSNITWNGATGFIHEYLAKALNTDCEKNDYYIAGPPVMVDAVRRYLVLERSVPIQHLYYDRFY